MQKIFDNEISVLFLSSFLPKIEYFEFVLKHTIYMSTLEPVIRFRCIFDYTKDFQFYTYSTCIEIFFDNHCITQFLILIDNWQGYNKRITGLSLDKVKNECKKVLDDIKLNL